MGAERLWIMVDVETSGPVLGVHSLVELGAAVGLRVDGMIDRFSALVRPTSEHVEQSRSTFAAARERGDSPRVVMENFRSWAKPYLAKRATFVARPAAFDWPWVVYYAWAQLHENPFGFKAVCASSWFEARGKRFHVKIPHVAVDDAALQLDHFLKET